MITGVDLLIRRSYPASPEWVWKMWTTPDGIGAWWAPEGGTLTVDRLDLRVGGSLDYTMTSGGPERVVTRSHKEFIDLHEPCRLAYHSLIDYVPGVAPYLHRTVVSLEPTPWGTAVEMWVDPLHDLEWTERMVSGRADELDNLQLLVTAHAREERLRA